MNTKGTIDHKNNADTPTQVGAINVVSNEYIFKPFVFTGKRIQKSLKLINTYFLYKKITDEVKVDAALNLRDTEYTNSSKQQSAATNV